MHVHATCGECGRAWPKLKAVKAAAIAPIVDIASLSEPERFAHFKATAPALDLKFYIEHARETADSPVFPFVAAMVALSLTLSGPVATQKRLVWETIARYKAAASRQPGYWQYPFTQDELDAQREEREETYFLEHQTRVNLCVICAERPRAGGPLNERERPETWTWCAECRVPAEPDAV